MSRTTTFTLPLACRLKVERADFGGSVSASLSGGGGTAANCGPETWTSGNTFDRLYLEHGHWTFTHDLLTPGIFEKELVLSETAVGGTLYLNTHFLAYTGVQLPPRLGYIKDPSETDHYSAVASDIEQYEILDPGGNSALIVGGLDVTPSLGSYYQLTTSIKVWRLASGSDALWRVVTNLAGTEYLFIEALPNDTEGTVEFSIRSQSV